LITRSGCQKLSYAARWEHCIVTEWCSLVTTAFIANSLNFLFMKTTNVLASRILEFISGKL
jgi:hypothetical protein